MQKKIKKKPDKLFTITPSDYIIFQGRIVTKSSKPWLIGAKVAGWADPGVVYAPVITPNKLAQVKKYWNRKKKVFEPGTYRTNSYYPVKTPLNVIRGQGITAAPYQDIAVINAIGKLSGLSKVTLPVEDSITTIGHDTDSLLRGMQSATKAVLEMPAVLQEPYFNAIIDRLRKIGLMDHVRLGKTLDIASNQPVENYLPTMPGQAPCLYHSPAWGNHVVFDYPCPFETYETKAEHEADIKLVQDYVDRKFPKDDIRVDAVHKRWMAYISDGNGSPEKLSNNLKRSVYMDKQGMFITHEQVVDMKAQGLDGYFSVDTRQGPLLYLGPALAVKLSIKQDTGWVNLSPVTYYVAPTAMFRKAIAKYKPDVEERMPEIAEDELIYIACHWCQRLTLTGMIAGTYDLHNSAVNPRTFEHFLRIDVPTKVRVKYSDSEQLVRVSSASAVKARLAYLKAQKAEAVVSPLPSVVDGDCVAISTSVIQQEAS